MLSRSVCFGLVCALALGQSAFGAVVQAFVPANTSPNDGVLWGALGIPLGTHKDGTGSGFTVISNLGLSITLNESGDFILDQQGTNWGGNYPAGSYVMNNNAAGPITFTFGTAVMGFGTYIDSANAGSFTGTINAYDSSHSLLASYTAQGTGLQYLGFRDTVSEVSFVTISTDNGNNFGMGDLNLRYFPGGPAPGPAPLTPPATTDTAATPEPGSLLMVAGMGLAVVAFRMQRRSRS